MKNMKKLFVILPLVLVLILSVLPVSAVNVKTLGIKDYNKAGDNITPAIYRLATTTGEYPVWVREYNKARQLVLDDVNLNNYDGTVKANLAVVSPLQLVNSFLQTSGLDKTYKVSNLVVDNLFMVSFNVFIYENQLNANWIAPEVTAAPTTKVVAKTEVVTSKVAAAGAVTSHDVTVNDVNGKPVVVTVPGQYEVITEKAVTPSDVRGKLLNYKVDGYVVLVDKLNTNVTVKHHAVVNGVEQVYTTEQTVSALETLTAAKVPATWATTIFAGVSYDAAKTVVTPNYKFDLTLGQDMLQGYTVDMYYTAATAAAGVDAAKAAPVAANVAVAAVNANVQLPATGAAGIPAVSVLLTALGFALSKKH